MQNLISFTWWKGAISFKRLLVYSCAWLRYDTEPKALNISLLRFLASRISNYKLHCPAARRRCPIFPVAIQQEEMWESVRVCSLSLNPDCPHISRPPSRTDPYFRAASPDKAEPWKTHPDWQPAIFFWPSSIPLCSGARTEADPGSWLRATAASQIYWQKRIPEKRKNVQSKRR